jgi:hypothetical protein
MPRANRIEKTTPEEIFALITCTLIMSYNRVPKISDYWSQSESLGNRAVQKLMSRDRFLLLHSKLYFNIPEKPIGAAKTYYIDEVVSCFKYTFSKSREDSPYQSIDEAMTKFKGRSSLKQFQPLKPTKRGVKKWMRCDAKTGYVYDFNIYAGAENNTDVVGTLGERVVNKLCSTIRNPNVTICFDRFFTSVKLVDTLPFACVGTVMTNRKKLPPIKDKLNKSESLALCSNKGTLVVKWQYSKEVMLLSNCHKNTIETTQRENRAGEKVVTNCPSAIIFYNKYMGGVDTCDQIAGLYDFDNVLTCDYLVNAHTHMQPIFFVGTCW